MKKRADIVNLYDFVSNKTKTENDKKEQTQINKSIEQRSKSNGLETLLHFNNSQVLSSIRSHRQEIQNTKDKGSLYNKMIFNAKDQILEMKKRRIQMEKKWRGKEQYLPREKYPYRSQSQMQASLTESQVQPYQLISIFPIRPLQKQKGELTDDFVLKLKKDILSGKVQKLTKTVIRIVLIRFVIQLKQYHELVNFSQASRARVTRQTFQSWKEVIRQFQQREKIKEAIVQRIKARKFPAADSYFP